MGGAAPRGDKHPRKISMLPKTAAVMALVANVFDGLFIITYFPFNPRIPLKRFNANSQ
jgi:hypothetical protein